MTDVDTEIKALDKALNKLIPALSDNISELKDIVNRTPKEEKPSEAKKALK
jgi:fructose-1-phosphate kinase PfkB-like protein